MNNLLRFISRRKISIIVTIVVLAILFAAVFHMDASESDATHASTKYFTCIQIQPGDSLWSIAEKYMTDEYQSIDDYIDEVCFSNHIEDESQITAGTNLIVPYYKVDNME